MPKKKTFDVQDDVLKLWLKYEADYDASFSKMANRALLQYLKKKLNKN